MKILSKTILLLLCSGLAMAEVGNNDLNEIRNLTKTGQYQQALEKHMLFHEESKSSSGMGGVRLSYALSAWIELGEKYPPALEALIQVRENDKEKLLSGKGGFDNFHDLSAINQRLGEDEKTLELLLTLDEKHPEQLESYYIVAEDLLIKHKKYDICAKYIGDPIAKYESLRYRREMELSLSRKNPKLNNSKFLDHADQSYIDGVIALIEVLTAINKLEDAREVQKRALSYFPSESIKYAIQ